jgi:hypothetical protein
MFDLKRLSPEAVPAALEKAMRYRTLNEPEQAESICEDILHCDPENQQALATLILAITDRFDDPKPSSMNRVRELIPRLHGQYERDYYTGIMFERLAIAKWRSGVPGCGSMAYDYFERAMKCYEKAEQNRPHGNDDSILRWNSCARMIMKYPAIAPEESHQEVTATLGE